MKRFLVCAILLCLSHVRADYVRPSWVRNYVPYWNGEDPLTKAAPADPAEWPSAQAAGFYYIWPQGPGATDADNTYGYPDKPRVTRPSTVAAGSVVFLRGTFNAPTTTWYLTFNGTAEAPCWFRGDPEDPPNIQIASIVVKGSWVFIENLTLGNGLANTGIAARPHNNSTIHHLVVRNVHGTGLGIDGTGSVFSVYGLVSAGVRNTEIIFYQCSAQNYGDFASSGESDFHAFHPSGSSGYVDNVWILDCAADDMGGDGVQIGNATATAPNWGTNIFVDQFDSGPNGENAIDIKGCANVVVSRVTGHGYDGHKTTSPGEGFIIHNNPTNVWLINNRIYDSVIGMISTGAVKQYWIGNRIEDCEEGLAPDRGGGTIHAYQNLVARCGIGLTGTGTIAALRTANNIIWDHGTRSLELTTSGVRAASTLRNDLIWEPGGAVSIDWGTIYTSVASWDSAQAAVSGALEADPLFADAGADNFALQSSSPARGAGYDWTPDAEADFYSAFGWTPTFTDINGVAFESTLDLGAIMFAGDVPTAPTGLVTSSPTSSSLTVGWTDASDDETGFSLEISTVGSGSGFTEVATPAADATSAVVSGLSASTTYYFRIRAVNASGYSAYSAEASGTTSAASTTVHAGTATVQQINIVTP
jgi:hypothetical protein